MCSVGLTYCGLPYFMKSKRSLRFRKRGGTKCLSGVVPYHRSTPLLLELLQREAHKRCRFGRKCEDCWGINMNTKRSHIVPPKVMVLVDALYVPISKQRVQLCPRKLDGSTNCLLGMVPHWSELPPDMRSSKSYLKHGFEEFLLA